MAELTSDQERVLECLGDGYRARRLQDVADDLRLPVRQVRSCCRELVAMGLAEYTYLVVEDEGTLAGWGYWRNSAGDRVVETIAEEVNA